MKDKKKILYLGIIISFLIMLVISASYAYFEVSSKGTTETLITGKTTPLANIAINTLTGNLKLILNNNDMAIDNLGEYYADDESNYVRNVTEGTHKIVEVSLTGDENNYACSSKIIVEMNVNKESDMGRYLEEGDLTLYLKVQKYTNTIDMSSIKEKGRIELEANFIINNKKSMKLETYVRLNNSRKNQTYLQGKELNINVTMEDVKCMVTKEEVPKEIPVKNCTYDGELISEKAAFEDGQFWYTYYDAGIWYEDQEAGWNVLLGNPEIYNPNEKPCTTINGLPIIAMDELFGFVQAEVIDVSGFDTSHVVSMNNMFLDTSNLRKIIGIEDLDVSHVLGMASMFSNSGYYTEEGDTYLNLDLSSWDVSREGVYMGNMFDGFNGDVDMHGWTISDNSNVNSFIVSPNGHFNLDNWNLSPITDHGHLILSLGGFTDDVNAKVGSVSARNWDLSDNRAYWALFADTGGDIDLSGWQIPNDYSERVFDIFDYGFASRTLDLSGWNIPEGTLYGGLNTLENVQNLILDDWVINDSHLDYFYDFNSNSPDFPKILSVKNWDISSVTDMSGCFADANIDSLDLSTWDVSHITNMEGMFDGSIFNTLNISTWDVTKITEEVLGSVQINEAIYVSKDGTAYMQELLDSMGLDCQVIGV